MKLKLTIVNKHKNVTFDFLTEPFHRDKEYSVIESVDKFDDSFMFFNLGKANTLRFKKYGYSDELDIWKTV